MHQLQKRKLLIAINCVAGLSIFFFGYDQGMMGGVNNAENYYDSTMHFGYKDPETGAVVITNTVLQGAIVCNAEIRLGESVVEILTRSKVSIYYLGTLCGCLFGGSFGDQHGRIRTIGLGAAWAVFGASLQASAQNQYWMIFGKIFNLAEFLFLSIIMMDLPSVIPIFTDDVFQHV